jgi:aryl-alcohol dehydrogenase-like predicted oxidoreductase
LILPKRQLGQEGPEVAALGLGCFPMTSAYGRRDEQESLATIRLALDLGCSFLDTADVYGPHSNERLIGRATKRRRDHAFIATKFGSTPDGPNGRAPYVKQACEESLQRLGTDWIDLYYLHRVDPNTPIETTVGAMAELVSEGKVRYIGLSEASATTIRRAHKVHPLAAVQTEFSIWSRDAEIILPTLRELGIALVASSPLGRGFLVEGGIKRNSDPGGDVRSSIPRYVGETARENQRIAARVMSLADARGITASQLALLWLLHQGGDVVPIPGTARRSHLRENLGVANISVPESDVAHWAASVPPAVGERMSKTGMAHIGR